MSNGGKEQKKVFTKKNFKTELFKCCCFYLSVLVQKWNFPREKRKFPPGFLNRQKPQSVPLPFPPEFSHFPGGGCQGKKTSFK
jgi:hypothetical protein